MRRHREELQGPSGVDPSTCALSPPALSPGYFGTICTEQCAWGDNGSLIGQRGLPEAPGSPLSSASFPPAHPETPSPSPAFLPVSVLIPLSSPSTCSTNGLCDTELFLQGVEKKMNLSSQMQACSQSWTYQAGLARGMPAPCQHS